MSCCPRHKSMSVPPVQGIISDLFPGVVLPKPDYDAMTEAMVTVCKQQGLQPTEYFLLKVNCVATQASCTCHLRPLPQ